MFSTENAVSGEMEEMSNLVDLVPTVGLSSAFIPPDLIMEDYDIDLSKSPTNSQQQWYLRSNQHWSIEQLALIASSDSQNFRDAIP